MSVIAWHCVWLWFCAVPCIIHALTDLPEARRLSGVGDCPDCVQATGTLRKEIDYEAVRSEALATLLTSGRKAAVAVLSAVDVSATHLRADCPFFGHIAHMTPACFPGDRLHLQYVSAIALA